MPPRSRKPASLPVLQPVHENERVRPSGERPCPVCGKTMAKEWEKEFHVDVCGEHGVWFDKGEVEQMRDRIRERRWQTARNIARRAHERGQERGTRRGYWWGWLVRSALD